MPRRHRGPGCLGSAGGSIPCPQSRSPRHRGGDTRGPGCPCPGGVWVTHAVVGTDGVEGVGAADEEQALVPHQQHLDEVTALCLRRREGTVTPRYLRPPRPTPGCSHSGPHRCEGLVWGVFSPQSGIYGSWKLDFWQLLGCACSDPQARNN